MELDLEPILKDISKIVYTHINKKFYDHFKEFCVYKNTIEELKKLPLINKIELEKKQLQQENLRLQNMLNHFSTTTNIDALPNELNIHTSLSPKDNSSSHENIHLNIIDNMVNNSHNKDYDNNSLTHNVNYTNLDDIKSNLTNLSCDNDIKTYYTQVWFPGQNHNTDIPTKYNLYTNETEGLNDLEFIKNAIGNEGSVELISSVSNKIVKGI